MWPQIDSLQSYQVHQPGNAFVITLVAISGVESEGHLAVTVEWHSGVPLVNQTYDLEIERRLTRVYRHLQYKLAHGEFVTPFS